LAAVSGGQAGAKAAIRNTETEATAGLPTPSQNTNSTAA
jgi:hypothetical protein